MINLVDAVDASVLSVGIRTVKEPAGRGEVITST